MKKCSFEFPVYFFQVWITFRACLGTQNLRHIRPTTLAHRLEEKNTIPNSLAQISKVILEAWTAASNMLRGRALWLPLNSFTWWQCCRVAAIENHLAPALQGCCAAGLLVCRGAGLLCCRAAAQCGCFDAKLLNHRATFRVAGAAVVALCCRAAVCSAAALQGRCTAAPLHCRSGLQ